MGRSNEGFNEGNPNRTTYSYVGKAKDVAAGNRLAGRANPHGPNTHIKVDMTNPDHPKVSTKLRRKGQ
jgi:hypothetical protein